MKVGVIVTAHWSDSIRPNGNILLKKFLESLYAECTYDFHVYIVDNESEFKLETPTEKCTYVRIDNQQEKGLTGAWNVGLNLAYGDGCDILINCNDDLWFDETINKFIDFISLDNDVDVVYGPVTNGILSGRQLSKEPIPYVMDVKMNPSDFLGGFLFGFTKEHYKKFRYKKNEYFNQFNKHNGNDGKWGGQEGQWIENSEIGLRGKIVGHCFINHIKIRAWKKALQIERSQKMV